MGMFDDVNYECVCPNCKNKVEGFQSKEGLCVLDNIEPESVDNFYTACGSCGLWIEFDKIDNNKYKRTVQDKKHNIMPEHTKCIIIK